VPDLTPGHIFANAAEVGLPEVVAAINAAGVHSGSFPYTSANNFAVGNMSSIAANATNLMTCVEPDAYYAYMPALNVGGEHVEMYYCEDGKLPVVAIFYFLSFIFVSAFILISLFIGSVLISIMESVDVINRTTAASKQQKHQDAMEMWYMDNVSLAAVKRKQRVAKHIFEAWKHRNDEGEGGPKLKKFAEANLARVQREAKKAEAGHKTMLGELKKNPSARRQMSRGWRKLADEFHLDDISIKTPRFWLDPYEDMDKSEAMKNSPLGAKWYLFSRGCDVLATDPIFQGCITFFIIIASVMVGVQVTFDAEQPLPQGMVILDHIVSAVFLFEVLVKILAEGFKPWNYFFKAGEKGWNRLDFVIVAGSYTPLGSIALLLRMIRLFRVLKLLKIVPQLRMLLLALTSAMSSILYTCVLMFIFFYVVAIACIIIFQANDPWHWQNLHVAIMTLFRSATGDDWTDIMYTAQYGCDQYPTFLAPCDNPTAWGMFAVIFFVFVNIFGGLVFLNLFIGVVTAGMSASMAEMDIDVEADYRVKLLQMLPEGKDLSIQLCHELTQAFTLLDSSGANRLDCVDVQLALHLVHLFPTKEQVNQMLARACIKLCEIQGKYHDEDDEDAWIDRGERPTMYTHPVQQIHPVQQYTLYKYTSCATNTPCTNTPVRIPPVRNHSLL
jgi:voltage-gated sodium channel